MLAAVTPEKVYAILWALFFIIVGLVAANIAAGLTSRLLSRRLSSHQVSFGRRGVYYGILMLFVFSALSELGLNLGVLLGAAGVLSVAIGFASQTSASNLISGLFLVLENPFSVDDWIKVGDTYGVVLSIDLLSTKVRTFDNLQVRIPNETLIKTEVTTLTKFPLRRVDLQLGVAYKEDLEKVRRILMELADGHPRCLEEPGPLFIFKGFGSSSIDLQFSVWTRTENWFDLKNELYLSVKRLFDANDIEIPFPHLSLYTGAVTEPFPVRFAQDGKGAGDEPSEAREPAEEDPAGDEPTQATRRS
ncbi:MAG: mechanosensitive ion channel family protein [Deltaproteobacteria bacterium]|nr:mechanosensitive ion channel family protein [Candidatus Anaeroferrophillacea bacterium]